MEIAIAAAVSAVVTGAEMGAQALINLYKKKPGPPTTSQQVSSGADGAPIPWLTGGTARWAGQTIWSSGITFLEAAQTSGKNGAIGFEYFANFAVAWGEGQPDGCTFSFRRIWADTKLLWIAPGISPNLQEAGSYGLWNSTANYQAGDIVEHLVIPPGTNPHDPSESVWRCIYPNTNQEPSLTGLYWEIASEYPPWNRSTAYTPGSIVALDTQVYACVNPNSGHAPSQFPNEWFPLARYFGAPANYTGDNSQMPDPLMESLIGIGNVPAYRGLAYSVWTRLPLANFGNRIPNMRIEANLQLPITPGNYALFNPAIYYPPNSVVYYDGEAYTNPQGTKGTVPGDPTIWIPLFT